jgi:hypothetical protein
MTLSTKRLDDRGSIPGSSKVSFRYSGETGSEAPLSLLSMDCGPWSGRVNLILTSIGEIYIAQSFTPYSFLYVFEAKQGSKNLISSMTKFLFPTFLCINLTRFIIKKQLSAVYKSAAEKIGHIIQHDIITKFMLRV